MASVSVLYLPHGEHCKKRGVDDYLVAGNTLDDLMNLRTTELCDPSKGESVRDEAASRSEALIRYADDADLFHDGDGGTFAVVRCNKHRETHSVESEYLNKWLRQRFYDNYEKAPAHKSRNQCLEIVGKYMLTPFDGTLKAINYLDRVSFVIKQVSENEEIVTPLELPRHLE